jgi:hypothetical protein
MQRAVSVAVSNDKNSLLVPRMKQRLFSAAASAALPPNRAPVSSCTAMAPDVPALAVSDP